MTDSALEIAARPRRRQRAKCVVVVHDQTVVCVAEVIGTWSTYKAAEAWAQRRYGDTIEWEVHPLSTHRGGRQ